MKSNAAAFASLAAHIERVEALAALAPAAAQDVAEAVESELQRQIAAGTDADGKAWPRREDGGRPLAGAGKALTVVAAGKRVIAQLRGHIARHHRGIARGGVERPIFPAKGLPPRLAGVVRDSITKAFRRTMGGE